MIKCPECGAELIVAVRSHDPEGISRARGERWKGTTAEERKAMARKMVSARELERTQAAEGKPGKTHPKDLAPVCAACGAEIRGRPAVTMEVDGIVKSWHPDCYAKAAPVTFPAEVLEQSPIMQRFRAGQTVKAIVEKEQARHCSKCPQMCPPTCRCACHARAA